jgi:ABC-type branched-subunit amino acid transport system ATPase component
VAALRGIDFSLRSCETLGVIGPNGSGKTTLINLLSGTIRPSAGTIWLDQKLANGWAADRFAREGVARTFQNVRLFRALTAAENVEVGMASRGWVRRSKAHSRSRQLLDKLGIGAYRDRAAGTLPYGVQRRVEIARALAATPSVLLLDEPAAGMNEQESEDLVAAVRQLKSEQDLSVLIVEHDFQVIKALCDRVMVIDGGELLAEGTPAEVRADSAVVEAYLGSGAPSEHD